MIAPAAQIITVTITINYYRLIKRCIVVTVTNCITREPRVRTKYVAYINRARRRQSCYGSNAITSIIGM
jgi:hypothetical protein